MVVEVDLEGRTPVPKWQMIACLVLAAIMTTGIVADLLGVLPRPEPRTVATVNRLEQTVNEIKTDQDGLRLDQEKLRKEMRAGFAEIRGIIGKKQEK